LKELGVSVGIYAMGAFVFTILARAGIAIQLGHVGRGKPQMDESAVKVEEGRPMASTGQA
jgi:hypothetical protein